MRFFIVVAISCSSLLQGCTFLQQRANHFESNSFVGYARPSTLKKQSLIVKGTDPLQIMDVNTEKNGDPSDYFAPGDCIVIDLVDGYYNQNFETGLEKMFGEGTTRNEVVITTAIYEKINSTSLAKDSAGEIQGAEYFIHNGLGQLEGRPFTFENVSIYGPRPYNGGDIAIEISMLEKDKEEIKQVTDEISAATTELNSIIPADQRTNLKSVASQVLSGATLSLTGAGYVAVGVSAVEIFNKAYKQLNEDDDAIIKHSFSLASYGRSEKTYQPYLREGYYPLIRIAVDDTVKDRLSGALYDPLQRTLTAGTKPIAPLWLTFRASKVASCGH